MAETNGARDITSKVDLTTPVTIDGKLVPGQIIEPIKPVVEKTPPQGFGIQNDGLKVQATVDGKAVDAEIIPAKLGDLEIKQNNG